MEILLLGIYSFFVWLFFNKLKLLPWTTPWKVAVAIFPVVAIAALLLLLNIFAPTTSDVRVIKYVVPIVSQVKGRVIEVPVVNNRPVKKGDVLFRIDPTPYQNEVNSLEARLVSEEAKVNADRARLDETQARLADAHSGERQLNEQLNEATGQVTSISASLELARKRVAQNTELAAAQTLCDPCIHRARDILRSIPAALTVLHGSLQRERSGDTGRAGTRTAPLPCRADVLNLVGPAAVGRKTTGEVSPLQPGAPNPASGIGSGNPFQCVRESPTDRAAGTRGLAPAKRSVSVLPISGRPVCAICRPPQPGAITITLPQIGFPERRNSTSTILPSTNAKAVFSSM